MTSAGVSSRVGAAAGHTPHTALTPGCQPVLNIAHLHCLVLAFVKYVLFFTGTQMISVCNASVFWGDITLAYHMFAVKVQNTSKFHSEINRDRRAGEQLHTRDRVSYLYADSGRV